MTPTQIISVTLFGETREVECRNYGHAIDTVKPVVVGRFPTGSKLHRSPLRLWKRDRGEGVRPLTGKTAAIVDGEEWVADFTLYTHNRNTGRIVAWDDEAFEGSHAEWKGAY